MGLDSLVIAVAGAAAIGDDGDAPAGALHRHAGGVDVADAGDLRIGQRRCGRGNGNGFLAQDVARHVEVMDRHVAKHAARDREIVERQCARVFRDDRHQFKGTDLAGQRSGAASRPPPDRSGD